MASTSPSPTASPPPTSSPPPSTSQPDQTTDLPSPLTPLLPDSSPPPAVNSPPPETQASPPPATPASPPPETPASPPPVTPSAPPPSPPLSPPPPSPPNAPPPVENPPPPPVASSPPPPPKASPSPPPPPPPEASPSPPVAETSPPPQESAKSPPPPEKVSNSPSPPASDPPKGSPPPPAARLPPPPYSPTSSPTPVSNLPANPSPPLLQPDFPTQKPTAKSTVGSNVRADGTAGGGGGGMKTGGAVAIGTIVGFVVLSLAFMALWIARKKKRRSMNFGYANPSPYASQTSGSSFLRSNSPPPLLPTLSGSDSKAWFSYEELDQATNGFSAQNLLGEGGFGCVYKGVLVDGRVVAVKQLKIGGGQGEREFRAEVEIISRVHHRYLVSLVGYCISDHQRLLVYDFVANDTLDHHLHGEGMDWATRVKVAAGAARGIAYLHEDCHPRIIHRDIKSSNILLDNNYDAQVSDFGLAKLALDSNTHVTTRVMGTFGYLAPEYATSGKLTEKSDVYSYGVVLLELITGRKPVDASQPLGDESLVEWARPLLSEAIDTEDFDKLVDPRLGKNYIKTEMVRMIEAAAACVRHSATKRPRMGQVVRALASMDDDISDLSNGVRPGQSEVFDSQRQSEVWGFDSRTNSSWASREQGDRTRSSFGARDYDRFQSQSGWSTREHGNEYAATPAKKSALAGFWDN